MVPLASALYAFGGKWYRTISMSIFLLLCLFCLFRVMVAFPYLSFLAACPFVRSLVLFNGHRCCRWPWNIIRAVIGAPKVCSPDISSSGGPITWLLRANFLPAPSRRASSLLELRRCAKSFARDIKTACFFFYNFLHLFWINELVGVIFWWFRLFSACVILVSSFRVCYLLTSFRVCHFVDMAATASANDVLIDSEPMSFVCWHRPTPLDRVLFYVQWQSGMQARHYVHIVSN